MIMITQIHVDGLPDRDALAALLYEHWLKKHPRACSRVDPQGNFHVLNWWDVDWDYHLKGPYYLDDTTTVADFASALYQGQFDESGKHRVCRERDEFRGKHYESSSQPCPCCAPELASSFKN